METIWRLDGAYSGNEAVTLKYQIPYMCTLMYFYKFSSINCQMKRVIPFTSWAFKLILKVLNRLFTIISTTLNCPCFPALWNGVFHYARLLDAVQLLHTLVYVLYYLRSSRFYMLYYFQVVEEAVEGENWGERSRSRGQEHPSIETN